MASLLRGLNVAASLIALFLPETVNGQGPGIRTDSDAVPIACDEYGCRAEVPFTFTNRTGEVVYFLPVCSQVQRLETDGWEGVSSGYFCALALPAPVVLQPGESHSSRVPFLGVPLGVPTDRLRRELLPGTYRVVHADIFFSFDPRLRPWGEHIPLEHRTSNVFELTRD
jgi:hypothetical protein